MAEQYALSQEILTAYNLDDAENQEQSPIDNLTHVDFRSNLTRQEIMHRIGEVVTSWWLTRAGGGAISHEPIDMRENPNGDIGVRFKEYKRGFSGSEYGIPHSSGWSGLETISVLDIEWSASAQTIEPHYVHPRNFRYILPQHESRIHAHSNDEATSTIRQELWDEQ